MKNLLMLISCALIGFHTSQAQDENSEERVGNGGLVSFNYAISMPLGSAGDYIGEPSFRGFNFDYRRKLTDHVTAGIMVGWTHFYVGVQRERAKHDAVSLFPFSA